MSEEPMHIQSVHDLSPPLLEHSQWWVGCIEHSHWWRVCWVGITQGLPHFQTSATRDTAIVGIREGLQRSARATKARTQTGTCNVVKEFIYTPSQLPVH